MDEPSSRDVRAFMAEGHTQLEAAEHFGLHRSKIQRLLKAGEDDRGPVERSVDLLIRKWGDLDEERQARADLIRAMAATVDWARSVGTGQGRTAGIQAAQALWKFLEDVGASSGMEELRKFLADL